LHQQLDTLYAAAQRIYVVQDNWNIHTHPDVQTALRALPRIEQVWLPTYASWLNPIEKLWRWLRQDVLHHHRYAEDWNGLKQQVASWLDHFAHGSQDLLR
jgi:transposase